MKRQKLMDAYEEAKNEHYNSLRISLGHPEFGGQIDSLKSRELERKKKHSRAVKDRAEILRETFESSIREGLTEFFELIKNLMEQFDRRVLLDEIISGDDDRIELARSFTWPDVAVNDIPKLTIPPFKSAKKTVAHIALFKARDLFCKYSPVKHAQSVLYYRFQYSTNRTPFPPGRYYDIVSVVKIKTMYRSGLLDVKTAESNELEEITRWTTFWKLQLSEVQACFQDI